MVHADSPCCGVAPVGVRTFSRVRATDENNLQGLPYPEQTAEARGFLCCLNMVAALAEVDALAYERMVLGRSPGRYAGIAN